jgi:hypothetical protein
MKAALWISVLALGCSSSPSVDCSTLGAPPAVTLTITFATATAATFAIDGTTYTGGCQDLDPRPACMTWTIGLRPLADGPHTLAVTGPPEAARTATFTITEVKDGCGEQAAQPDTFSF